MKIETRALGTIEIDDERILNFVSPVLGVEGASRYALLDLDPSSPVKILQGAGDPDRCFLVADPALLFPEYRVTLSRDQVTDLGLENPEQAAVLVILNVRREPLTVTANLLGPIVVNAETFMAKQVVLRGSGYRADEPVPLRSAAP